MLIWLCLAAGGPAAAQAAGSAERMGRDMTALSTDAMEGREPGTSGEAKALAWLEAAFAQAGLEPAGAVGWRQPVHLVERTELAGALRVRVGGRNQDLGDAVLLVGKDPDSRIERRPIVYAGYAAQKAPLPRGAVVLLRNVDPPGQSRLTREDFLSRRAELVTAGAGAILEILDDAAFQKLRADGEPSIELGGLPTAPIRGFIPASAASRLLEAAGQDLAALETRATSPDFTPVRTGAEADIQVRTQIRRFTSYNVVGRIRGGARPHEAVVYTAHWDSFGHCRKEGADQLCNGAVDNASGVAALLETARLFKAGAKPARTVVFVATTAEERGLLGARAYAQHPAVPLRLTVAAFNYDTITIYGRGAPIGFVGGGLTTADSVIAQMAAGQSRALDPSVQAFIKRSDTWALLQAGVPAFLLSGAISRSGPDGGKAFLDYVKTRYHGPSDEMHPDIPFDGAAQDVELNYRLGLAFADAKAAVDFLPSAPFRRP